MTDLTFDLLAQFGDVLPEAFWAIDLTEDRTLFVSPGFEELWGISTEAFYQDPRAWLAALHPDDRGHIEAMLERDGLSEHDTEYRVVRPDGSVRWVHSRGFALRDGSGKPYRLIGLSLDITTQKATENALREALDVQRMTGERLEELGRLKDEVLRRVSHELRTPLAAILGFSQLLEKGDIPSEQSSRSVQMIAKSAEKLQGMLADLLDLDRLNRGVLPPVKRETDIHSLLLSVVDGMRLLQIRPVQIDVDRVAASVDANQVARMVEGLLDNAVRHTPDATPISLKAKASGTDLMITVEDNGPGVPVEFRSGLFDPFVSHTPSVEYSPGLGIGLGLVHKFVQLHGGTIEVDDREGGGAVFTIVLPDAVLAPNEASEELAGELSHSVVLVIDDDEQIRAVATRLLDHEGVQCTAAADGSQGLSMARTLQPRLVILDINMPGLSGTDVLIRLRADPRTAYLPVLMLTGESLPVVKAQHLLLGADDYMVKPFTGPELMEHVRAILDRSGSRGTSS